MSSEIFSLKQFRISTGYNRIKKLGDPLYEVNNVIEWEGFRKHFYQNNKKY